MRISVRLILLSALIAGLFINLVPRVSGQHETRPLILGDNSGSMAGFAKADPNRVAALYQLLIRDTGYARLHALSDGGVFGSERQAAFFSKTAGYRGNTDLIKALSDIRKHEEQAILVTDGMQSEGLYLGLKEHLTQMAAEEWGIWLIAIDIAFNGTIDSEQLIQLKSFQPEIEDCIHQRDASSSVDIASNANRFYVYRGIRPILIFLFYKNSVVGREQTMKIVADLDADPQFDPKAVEISPLVRRGVTFADPQLVDLADAMRVDNFSTGNAVIRSDTTDGKRLKELRIPIIWEAEPPPLLQALNEAPRYDHGKYPWLDNAPETEEVQENQDRGKVTGNLKIKLISEIGFFRRNFCWLPGVSCSNEESEQLEIQTWSEYVSPDTSWWNDLNIDNSWQCPAKVYKLSELVNEVSSVAAEHHKAKNPPKKTSFKLIVGPL